MRASRGRAARPASWRSTFSTTSSRTSRRGGQGRAGDRNPAGAADVAAAFREFGAALARLALPSSPQRLITVHADPFCPQPRLDRDADGGMTTSVGRIRADPALENGIKYILVSHNTKMGATKGAVLTAEYLVTAGYI